MERRTIRDADFAIWQSGRGSRHLVFVHGFQNDHSACDAFTARLDAARYHFTSFDLLGCGASGNGTSWERCTIDEYASDLIAMIDALRLTEPVVVGHSLGGAIGLRAALSHPGR